MTAAPLTRRLPTLRADLIGTRCAPKQLAYIGALAAGRGWTDADLDQVCAGWAAAHRRHVGPPEELSLTEARDFIAWLVR